MADERKKLSAAPAASTLTGVELLFTVQGGVTKKSTPAQMAAYVGSAALTKAAILAALGIDQFDVTANDITIGLNGKIIILPLE